MFKINLLTFIIKHTLAQGYTFVNKKLTFIVNKTILLADKTGMEL